MIVLGHLNLHKQASNFGQFLIIKLHKKEIYFEPVSTLVGLIDTVEVQTSTPYFILEQISLK